MVPKPAWEDEDVYNDHFYPWKQYLGGDPRYIGHTLKGAYDDAFIEITYKSPDPQTNTFYVRNIFDRQESFTYDESTCQNFRTQANSNPPESSHYLIVQYADCETTFHDPLTDRFTPPHGVELLGVNFLRMTEDGDLPDILFETVGDPPRCTGLDPEHRQFFGGSAVIFPNLAHEHAFNAVGLPHYYNNIQSEECPGGYDPPAAPMDQFLRVFHASIHELGHLIGGFMHVGSPPESTACPNDDTVMDTRYFPDDSFTTYFCREEILLMRREPRYQ